MKELDRTGHCIHCGSFIGDREHECEELALAAQRAEWRLGDYDNDETGCPHCGRFRLCLCPNGKHRCEKCNWCPELGGYAPFID